jgi:subtilisin-like proprotein convertase family protein
MQTMKSLILTGSVALLALPQRAPAEPIEFACSTPGVGTNCGATIPDFNPTHTPTPGPSQTPTDTPAGTRTPTRTPTGTPTASMVSSDVQVVAQACAIQDLDVQIQLEHPWVGDLLLTLSHGSTSVTVVDRPGLPARGFGCLAPDLDAVLDDEAAASIETQCSPEIPVISGTFRPSNPLSTFDGQDAAGAWTLTIADRAEDADEGRLTDWGLILTCVPPVPALPGSAASIWPWMLLLLLGGCGMTIRGRTPARR